MSFKLLNSRMKTDHLTNALHANLPVTSGALTGEGTQSVDALLAGLAVVFMSHTLVHIWEHG